MALSDYSHGNEIDSPDTMTVTVPVISRTVKDPIHAMIPLTPRLSTFIDTKQFQRLRYIKQLGISYYVWLGAAHNRFEHCIGVAFLARSMATHLQKSQPELRITDRDVECVEIAGLCHDLGHGPWSHVWDNLFIPQALKGSKWKHEDGSEMMFDSLVKENNIPLKKKDERFIKALIAGEPSKCDPDEKSFLFDIVANKRNGLDVDKFDYILRDSHMIGDPMSIALPRIIQSARVLDNQICYDFKDANQIYEICAMRFKLHKIVYNHKSAKAIEYMVIDGLLAADPHLGIAERVHDPKKYLYLTDDIMPQIEASTDPNLAPARAIFDRIRSRDLYRMVDFIAVDWPSIAAAQEHMTPEKVVAGAKALHGGAIGAVNATPVDVAALTKDDVVVDFTVMHYGMKEKNPLDSVKFYSKREPFKCLKAQPGDYSTLMPQYHAELLVRVYTKKPEYFGLVQAGFRECMREYNTAIQHSPPPDVYPYNRMDQDQDQDGEQEIMAPTPPITEAPTTPRTRASPSFTLSVGGGGGGPKTPLIPNEFMTVSSDFVPPPKSPMRVAAVLKPLGAADWVRRRGSGESGGVGAGASTTTGINIVGAGASEGAGGASPGGDAGAPVGAGVVRGRVVAGMKRGRGGSRDREDLRKSRSGSRDTDRDRGAKRKSTADLRKRRRGER